MSRIVMMLATTWLWRCSGCRTINGDIRHFCRECHRARARTE